MRELAPELLPEGLLGVVCVGVAGIPPLWKSSGRSASAYAKLSSNRVVPRNVSPFRLCIEMKRAFLYLYSNNYSTAGGLCNGRISEI